MLARATRALGTATSLTASDPDAAASRAYYVAFYAASAWLVDNGHAFSKHSSVETAVHRDLVKTGILPVELGAHYIWLHALRNTGDYGGRLHVSVEEASIAVRRAEQLSLQS